MRIAMVGAELEENLSVRYIGATLAREGHEVCIVPFSTVQDEERAAESIVEWGTDLVGLSMVFQARASEFMGLAARLREKSWAGHLTCGGHFATFNHKEILGACPAIDTVVRHEGELAMVDLAHALARGEDLAGVEGVTFRRVRGEDDLVVNPSRRPVDDLDSLAFPLRDARPPLHLGVPVASMVASRGCYGDCTFCCINAWHRTSGGKRVRRRSVGDVVDEMAVSYHARGVRIYIFHDDNFFTGSKRLDLERIGEMGRRMREARMEDVSLVVKARPNDVDLETFTLLREMGLERVYLGIENASENGLRALNRRVTPADNERALTLLRDLGVFVCFNLLVFEPDMQPRDVVDNLEFMERHASVPHNFCRAECYTASTLQERLREQGRLSGDYLGADYAIGDPRMETLFRIFSMAFFERNFSPRSVANDVMGLGYELHLLRRYHPREVDADLERRVAELTLDVTKTGAARLREAYDFVMGTPLDHDRVRDFALDLATRGLACDYSLACRLGRLKDEIEHRAARGRQKAAAACAVAAAPPLAAMTFLKAAALVPVLTLSLLTSSCGTVDPAPVPTTAPPRPTIPPPDPVPSPGHVRPTASPRDTGPVMPPPDPVPTPFKPGSKESTTDLRSPAPREVQPPYTRDPMGPVDPPPTWPRPSASSRSVTPPVVDPVPGPPNTQPKVDSTGPGARNPFLETNSAVDPIPGPPSVRVTPKPSVPPPVDPPPPPSSPSPTKRPGPRAELPLPRTLQGSVVRVMEPSQDLALRLDYAYCGPAVEASAEAGPTGTWVAPDGVQARWQASVGEVRVRDDGTVSWIRPAGQEREGHVTCILTAPDGSAWVAGWHEA